MDLFKTVNRLLSAYTIKSFGESLVFNSEGPIKCVSLSNQPCQARLKLVDINFKEVLFYSFCCLREQGWWRFDNP